MQTYTTEKLLNNLAADVRQIIRQTEPLKKLGEQEMRTKPVAKAWSVTEILAHLNFYARYYLQAMEAQMDSSPTTAQAKFKPGWLGNYFTKLIGPGPEGIPKTKLQAPSGARPKAPETLDPQAELQEFIRHQHELLNLLQIAASTDIGRIRVPITLSRFIRLKLGDTFRFLIAHEQRHFQQIDRTLASCGIAVEALNA